jgi:hypothetical protein
MDNESTRHKVAKSFNFDSMPQGELLEGEVRTSNGNIIALACGPLKRGKRYINPKIELELVEFKKEIEDKFAKSLLKRFVMPKNDH